MRTLWGLLRAMHLGPTLAVTALAALLSGAFGLSVTNGALVTLAVFLNQASVGISNDAIDAPRDIDAKRWEKPIASGVVSLPLAWGVASVSAIASLALSLWIHPLVGLWQGVFILAGWAYNFGLKSTLWSGACYAIGFGALPVLVSYASETPLFPPWWVVFVAASLGLSAHFANVLPDLVVDRLHGIRGLPHQLGPRVIPPALVGLTAASGAALVTGAGPVSAAWTLPAAAIALALSGVAAVRARQTGPGALPFQLSMTAALVMALGLAVGLAG